MVNLLSLGGKEGHTNIPNILQSRDKTEDLVVRRQRSYQLRQPRSPFLNLASFKINFFVVNPFEVFQCD